MNNIKKIITCLVCLALVFSLAACGSSNDTSTPAPDTNTPAPETTPAPEQDETPDAPADELSGSITYFSLYLAETSDNYKNMTASDNGDGTMHIEYTSDIKKMGEIDADALEAIAEALKTSGLVALNGTSEFSETGEAYASMYIELSDGSYLSADYSGEVAEAFVNGFDKMLSSFVELCADMPEYVPQAEVMGEVDADSLAAMQDILNNSGMPGLDGLMISDIPMDEYFAFTAGLTATDCIATGTNCTAMMMTTPYSLVIVKANDVNSVAGIHSDFEANINWTKWVCVNPTAALIAEKDNMVLCLMGAYEMFDLTKSAIEAAGWTNITVLDNPNM